MSLANGSRVDVRNVLDVRLRSGRRIEYESPLVGGVPRSPAHDVDNVDNKKRFVTMIHIRRKLQVGMHRNPQVSNQCSEFR